MTASNSLLAKKRCIAHDMADFDDLFHSLGYTENDPNWIVPKD